MKRLLSRLIPLLAAVMLLWSCGLFGKPVTVKWFAGIESELNDDVKAAMESAAADFNERNRKVRIELVTLGDEESLDYLKGRLDISKSAHITGPLSIQMRERYRDSFLDLAPLIEESGYDMSSYDSRVLELYRQAEGGLFSIPFIIYPSFIYYNKRLFDELGLPYPPARFGRDYIDEKGVSHPWNMDTLRLLAMKLTRDSKALTPLEADFNPDEIIQFGFAQQWTDAGGAATLFGAAQNGMTKGELELPLNWREGWKWYYNAMWVDHFYPTERYKRSDFLNYGDYFKSGNVAMVQIHLWYAAFASLEALDWDIAVVPAYKDRYTARIHEDSFYIFKNAPNHEAAFEALVYLSNSEELRAVYDGMPADRSLQEAYFESFTNSRLAGKKIDWQVAVDSQSYCDVPHHESFIPPGEMAASVYSNFWDELSRSPDLNVDVKCDLLEVMLQDSLESEK